MYVGTALQVEFLWLPFGSCFGGKKVKMNGLWKPFYSGKLLMLAEVTVVLLAVSHLCRGLCCSLRLD